MKPSIQKKQMALDPQFWSHFSKNHWEKKPLAVKAPQSSVFALDEKCIFELLVRYSDRCRKLSEVQGMKLFVNGQRQYDEEVLQILPVKKDKSLLGYHRRMEMIFSDYCLVCDELLQVCEEQWDVLADFTEQLYNEIGLPNRFAEMGLYLGNYKKTPFGVHVDGCGVFSFPVVGTKKFRLWTPDYVKKNPRLAEAHKYSTFVKGSQLLTAAPGDMTYWPSTAWHIAESDGSFNATWSLGVWLDRAHREVVTEAFQGIIENQLKDLADLRLTPFAGGAAKSGELGTMPELFKESAVRLSNLSPLQVQDALLWSWLKMTSKRGLKTMPLKIGNDKKMNQGQLCLSHPKRPILWKKKQSDEKVFYAFNGVCIENSGSQKFHRLIQDLNSGKLCNLKSALGEKTAPQDLANLQSLAEAGAVRWNL